MKVSFPFHAESGFNPGFARQYLLGRCFVFLAGPVITLACKIMGYRIRNLAAARRRVAECFRRHRGPWLICANHLTMIDSVIISQVLFPFYRYAFHYRLLPWNLPEKLNLYRIHKVVAGCCYLLKCIPVVRGGSRENLNDTLSRCVGVLERGENLVIFPEGTRSRGGRIDRGNFPYSVGRFYNMVEGCRVLCIYLRGDHQSSFSNVPRFGERFTVAVEDFRPTTRLRGLRAQREVAQQIIARLAVMEEAYFSARG